MEERNAYVLSHRLCDDVCHIIDDFISLKLNFSEIQDYVVKHGISPFGDRHVSAIGLMYGIPKKNRFGYKINLPENIIIYGKPQNKIEKLYILGVECVLFPTAIRFIDGVRDKHVIFENKDKNQFIITYEFTSECIEVVNSLDSICTYT